VLVEEDVEGGEAAQDVLGEVGAIDAQDRELAPAAQEALLELAHRLTPRQALGRPPVDRQRIGAHPDLAAVVADDAALHVHVEVQEVAAALEEVAPVGARVEADDVVGQEAFEDLLADVPRKHAPGIRLGPRDVDEVVQERVRPGLADHRRQRVEVVVVHHHDGLLLPVDLLQHGGREVVVDDVVAVIEGLDVLRRMSGALLKSHR
jgi:hypothetical protein